MQFRLGKNPPSARIAGPTALLLIEWEQIRSEAACDPCMRRRRSRRDDEIAIENLRHLLRGHLEKVFVRRRPPSHESNPATWVASRQPALPGAGDLLAC